MSTIGGLSSSTSSSISSIRGYGGLASGLDRDSLIESMTYATTAKIQAQKQKQQKLQWQQTAIQGISSKLIEFSQKYTSYTSSTNLSSASFFNRSSITANGANAGKVSISGNGSNASNISITGVKQMATNASMAMNGNASTNTLTTGALSTDLETKDTVSLLEGGELTFGYGTKEYSISLLSGTSSDGFTYKYGTGAEAAASINKLLSNVDVSTTANTKKALGDVLEAYVGENGSLQFRTKGDTAGNTITLKSGSKQAWDALGTKSDSAVTITNSGTNFVNLNGLTKEVAQIDRLAEKEITFSYNGTNSNIKLLSKDEITNGITIDGTTYKGLEAIQKDLQQKLDKAFGAKRIEVSLEPGGTGADGTITSQSLKFETKRPDTGGKDLSSILSLSSADSGVLGETGVLGVAAGTSNRLNLSSSFEKSGLKSLEGKDLASVLKEKVASGEITLTDKEQEALDAGDLTKISMDLTVNGTKIEGLTYASTISDIMSKINSADAGVKVSYLSNADKFTMEATSNGASGQIDLDGFGAELLFGKKDPAGDELGYTVTAGKDAIVTVKYAGSDETVELVRGSNSFSLNGMNVTVNGEFGYVDGTDDEGNPAKVPDLTSEAVTFTSKVDADKITSAVSDMITAFNEVLALVNSEVSTKPDRSYAPLTDQQRDEMTEEQIEKWETESKKGLLFNDTDLRSLADSMRFIFNSGTEDKKLLESFGITTSTNYNDNGKLVFDETKFRAALEKDPEAVQSLFTRQAGTNGKDDKGGFMTRISTIFNRFATTSGASKGILVNRAGSSYAPTSVLNNSLQKQLDSIDDYIERLNKKLQTETDRYIGKFTQLETLISQMNSQSSYLSQISGA